MPLILWLNSLALAADVIWLEAPTDALRARVATAAGATRDGLALVDSRSASTQWTPADDESLRRLEVALKDVRAYEARLDGELVILRDLAGPIAGVTALRDENDRDRLFAALAYQGFAANRYFDKALSSDPEAAPYRVDFNGLVVERPWADAVALTPGREITPYDIAEAPQRVAFARVRDAVLQALPASVTPKDLPAGATFLVDGAAAQVGASGNVKVTPGRHLFAAVLENRVVARWDVILAPGASVDAVVPLSDATWDAFIANLGPDVEIPGALAANVAALGGEVWLARPDGSNDATIFVLTPDGVRMGDLPKAPSASSSDVSLGFAVGVTGGWMSSGDFYTQDPIIFAHSKATVNSPTASLDVGLDIDIGVARIGAGVATWAAFGHPALSGDGQSIFRPYPHARAGLKWVQVSGGYLLPYHPAAGLHATIPLAGAFELRANGVLGVPGELTREDGTVYATHLTPLADAGFGLRF